jgi:small basic protein
MAEAFTNPQDKSAGDLGREALWFAIHTILAVLILAVMVVIGMMMHLSMDDVNPKIIFTVLALLVPMIGGYVIAKARQDAVAGYVWISGLLTFSIVCVWVLDLPTGPGMCEKCGALEKLSRTFFDIWNGSGLMGGDGVLVGTWIPLAMIGYAIGAKMGLD